MKDFVVAEELTMSRRDFDNEIAESLFKIYSGQIEDDIHYLTHVETPYNPFVDDTEKVIKDALEYILKERATKEQIAILIKKYKGIVSNRFLIVNPNIENNFKANEGAAKSLSTVTSTSVGSSFTNPPSFIAQTSSASSSNLHPTVNPNIGNKLFKANEGATKFPSTATSTIVGSDFTEFLTSQVKKSESKKRTSSKETDSLKKSEQGPNSSKKQKIEIFQEHLPLKKPKI